MAKSSLKKVSKDKKAPQAEGHSPEHGPRSNPADSRARLIHLQHAAGNQAVGRLLQSDAGIAVSQPGDAREREASRVADEAVHKPGPMAPLSGSTSKRLEKESGQQPTPAPSHDSPIQEAGSRGQPLSESDRAFFESRLGQDLSGVRIHTDARSAAQAAELNARAFTLGQDVVFGAGQYAPQTDEGRGLLAHELTHTVQQGSFAPGEATGATIMRTPKPGEPLAERVSLSKSKVPEPMVMRTPGGGIGATVYFGQDSFLLDSANFKAVEELGEALRFMSRPTVIVDGHASTEGTEEYNLDLSRSRRLLVIGILKGKSTDIKPTGEAYGEKKVAVEETAQGDELEKQRAYNRRVEIAIIPSVPTGPKRRIKLFPPSLGETPEEERNRRLTEPSPGRAPSKWDKILESLKKFKKKLPPIKVKPKLEEKGVEFEWEEEF
jgi:outer membrane protein OmpA-like peptidoglycan-associated protein